MDAPKNFLFGSDACGIKAAGNDIGLIVVPQNSVAVGVYTENLVRAACIDQNRNKTPTADFRAVIINSGNANACTGSEGETNAAAMAGWVAEKIGCRDEQILVLQTGVIGQQMPMEKVKSGIAAAYDALAYDENAITSVAKAFMTTDQFQKIVSREIRIADAPHQILGIAKGAGMIGPNMATMLCVLMTDLPLTTSQAQTLVKSATDQSFNRISVDGHTSTNDAVLLLAPESNGLELPNEQLCHFERELTNISIELAKMIPTDGEGAAHLVEINVLGAGTDTDADQIARVVAASNLVKTAISGCDPNWGRIVSAAGYAGIVIEPNEICLSLNGMSIFENGTPMDFDESIASQSMQESQTVVIDLVVGKSTGKATHWTSDLTTDYVKLNADYRT